MRPRSESEPPEEELAALADGSLPPERRDAVEALPESSPELSVRLDEQRRARELVREASAAVEAPTSLRERIEGGGSVTIQTILADQIFGVNLDQSPVNPINTFHVGFWFNDPNDAAACGFDVTKPTPFNGEHHAGPLAMISLPDATTGLGPLCLNPEASQPSGCDA